MFEEEYETEAEIPAIVRHLFVANTEGNKFILIPATELKTVGDVNAVQEGLRKERNDHKETKLKLSAFGSLDPKEVGVQLARIPELEASQGKIDDEAINKVVEARITSRLLPVQTELNTTKTQLEGYVTKVEEFETANSARTITDTMRGAGEKAKLSTGGLSDFLMYQGNFEIQEGTNAVVTREGIDGVVPGVSPEVFLTNVQPTKEHWWPPAKGAGSRGGTGGASGKNPFTRANWNMTEQGKLVTENRAKAEQLATSAGTTIGGGMPEEVST